MGGGEVTCKDEEHFRKNLQRGNLKYTWKVIKTGSSDVEGKEWIQVKTTTIKKETT